MTPDQKAAQTPEPDPGKGGPGGPSLTKSTGWLSLREAVFLGHGDELYWKQYVMLLSTTNVHILV